MQPREPQNKRQSFFRRKPELSYYRPEGIRDSFEEPQLEDCYVPETKEEVVPRFIRQAAYMSGYYELTPEADVNSKYFRYQPVPTDKYPKRQEGDKKNSPFKSLVDDKVLSWHVAEYLENYYRYRYNFIVAGGDKDTRTEIIEALLKAVPARNSVKVNRKTDPSGLFPFVLSRNNWDDANKKVKTRDDVIVFNEDYLHTTDKNIMMQHAIHNIFIAGIERNDIAYLREFRFPRKGMERSEIPHFNSITIVLGKCEGQDKRQGIGAKAVIRYQDYYNSASNLEEVAWYRNNGLFVRKHSNVVY